MLRQCGEVAMVIWRHKGECLVLATKPLNLLVSGGEIWSPVKSIEIPVETKRDDLDQCFPVRFSGVLVTQSTFLLWELGRSKNVNQIWKH